jgi:hypothetical protein
MLDKLRDLVAYEPVMVQSLLTALFATSAAVGLAVDNDIVAAVGGMLTAMSPIVAYLWPRNKVTPVVKLTDDDD